MKEYKNIKEIIKDFELDRNPLQLAEIKADLKKLLVENHPDKNGGIIKDEELYHKVRNAIDLVNALSSPYAAVFNNYVAAIESHMQSVKVNEYDSLIRSHIDSLRIKTNIDVKEKIIDSSTTEIKKKYWFPKITSGLLFLISSFLFSFQESFIKHPFLETYYNIELEKRLSSQALNHPFLLESDKSPITSKAFTYIQVNLDKILNSNNTKHYNISSKITYVNDFLEAFGDKYLIGSSLKGAEESNQVDIHSLATITDSMFLFLEFLNDRDPFFSEWWSSSSPQLIIRDIGLHEYREDFDNFLTFYSVLSHYFKNLENENTKAINRKVSLIIFILWSSSILLFLILWVREKSDTKYIKYLLSDAGLKFTTLKLISSRLSKKNTKFNEFHLGEAIKSKGGSSMLNFLLGTTISKENIESIVSHSIKRMLEKSLIKKIDMVDLYAWFEMDKSVIDSYSDKPKDSV